MNKLVVFLAGVLATLSSCHYTNGRHVYGNGQVAAEQRSVTGFSGVETHGSIDIVATEGSYNVKVESDQNLLQYIETVIQDGRLVVRFRRGISISDLKTATVYVSAPNFRSFETHGSGNIRSEGKIAHPDRMEINIAGSGNIQLNIDCPEVVAETHGSGNTLLTGQTKNFSSKTDGSGDLKAADLKAETVKVSIHGSGNNEVFASESLDVEIFGSGDVHYRGEPKINTAVHGSGAVSKMN